MNGDGSKFVGDKGNTRFTKVKEKIIWQNNGIDSENSKFQLCQTLGWRGKGTHFDLLPLVISESGGDPQLFELPDDLVLTVEIADPKNPKLTSLGLRWHALPAVSGMSLNVGGIVFPATAFSGWYSLPEVAVRDLLDQQRYNLLKVGRRPGHGPKNRGV